MTTTPLRRLALGIDARRAARVLECLEEEVAASRATYGLVITRAGQIVAADGACDEAALEHLAFRLVPVFLASRQLSATFHEWPIRATVQDAGQGQVVTQPLGENWMLAMVFESGALPASAADLGRRWLERLAPLAQQASIASGAARTRGGKRTIRRDSVDLLFKDE